MNQQQSRRYIFVDYESLKRIKFRKLEKVCDKVFVFIDSNENYIPFSLVRQMQRMGNALKWVTVDHLNQSGASYHITFLMGKLHEKVNYDIEFAILSNDSTYDNLISFINSEGRSCVRVKRKEGKTGDESLMSDMRTEHISSSIHSDFQPQPFSVDHHFPDDLIEKTATDTISRLVRSGNRPAEISTLKNYILLHNQEQNIQSNLELIIRRMEDKKEIAIRGHEVLYNF